MNTDYFVKKIKSLLPLFAVIFSFSPLISKAQESAKDGGNENHGLDKAAQKAFGDLAHFKNQEVPDIIGTVVGAALSFIGILFFVLIIYGGITWMTAAGNETQISKAKNLIISAIIGLIIVLAAYAITSFIGGALT